MKRTKMMTASMRNWTSTKRDFQLSIHVLSVAGCYTCCVAIIIFTVLHTDNRICNRYCIAWDYGQ